MPTPTFERERAIIQSFLTGFRLSKWKIEDIDQDFQTATYHVVFISHTGEINTAALLAEWIDNAEGPSVSGRMRLKRELRQALNLGAEDEEGV